MFRKLVSNLPFNPSSLGTLAFYAKRVKEENALRRMGFLFMALALFIQMFAVMAPPEKSLAYSTNNIINGLQTRDGILRAWDGQTPDRNVAQIYSRFGITREDIAALPMHPNTTIRSTAADYWSMGRNPLSASQNAGSIAQHYKDSEIPVNYGSGTVYMRQLRAWDVKNPSNTYKAFHGTSKSGKKFWILVDCGNLTFVGKPPLNKPSLELRKTIDGGPRTLQPGDTFAFRFEYRNPARDSYPVENVTLYDTLDLEHFEIVSPKNLPIIRGNVLAYRIGSVPYSANFRTALTIKVKLKESLVSGTKVCNAATLRGDGVNDASSGGTNLCINVIKPCPYNPWINDADPRCKEPILACAVTVSNFDRSTRKATLKTTVTSSNSRLTDISSYEYDFGDGSTQTKRSTAYSDTIEHTYKEGSYEASVVVNYTATTTEGGDKKSGSASCAANVDSEPDSPLGQSKTARNLTQNLDNNATPGSKAKAGDTIEYSLITNNIYGYERTNINTSDNIEDILEYADLDMAFLSSQKGSYDESTKTLSWSNQTVAANSQLENKFRVKLKNPLPSTNQPNAMTTSFDCQLSNKFGNQLDIAVDCPLPKTAETVSSTLPKTGPGESLAIGFTITFIAAYFFARSKLIDKELEIITADFAQTGGV